jgi:hypothetical protein
MTMRKGFSTTGCNVPSFSLCVLAVTVSHLILPYMLKDSHDRFSGVIHLPQCLSSGPHIFRLVSGSNSIIPPANFGMLLKITS